MATGQYYRSIDITPAGEPIHHQLDMVADSEDALNLSAKDQKAMTNLVAESGKLFGARHYRDYHFILGLSSDHVAHFGLEHHESNDSRLPENVLLGPGSGMALGGLLAHEFAHSWNGKYRRPADLAVPGFEEPMKTDLLWELRRTDRLRGSATCSAQRLRGRRINITSTWRVLRLHWARGGLDVRGDHCATRQMRNSAWALAGAAG